MNECFLIGRISNDLELRYTSNNKATCRFSVAVNRYVNEKQETDFINVQTWGNTAVNICNYLKKGNMIAVKGSLRTSNYEDKNRNKRSITYVLTEKVVFLSGKKEEKEQPKEEVRKEEDPFKDFGDSVLVDDDFLE